MAFQIRASVAGERERIADLYTLRRKFETKLGALLAQHPQIELGIVRDKQRVFPDELEELPHRLFRRNAVLAQKIKRKAMYPFRIRIHLARWADIKRKLV